MRAASAHAGNELPLVRHQVRMADGVGVVGHGRLVEGAGRARGRLVERRLLLELVEHVERPERRDGGHAVDVRGVEVLRGEVGVEDAHELRRATNVVCCMPLPMGFLPAELDLAMAPDCGQQSHSREPMGSRRGREKWADFGPGTLILIKFRRNPEISSTPYFESNFEKSWYKPKYKTIQSSPYFDPTHTRTGWIGQPPILDRLYGFPYPRGWFDLSVISADET